jgi:hypothetical protein
VLCFFSSLAGVAAGFLSYRVPKERSSCLRCSLQFLTCRVCLLKEDLWSWCSDLESMAAFNPPTNMDFSMGSTEQKMSMSLDDIIKHTKKEKGKMHRAAIKNGNRKLNGPGAKAALQKSVASRSSSMRQGKLAQARSNNGGVSFPATKAASKKAFAAPVNTRSRQFMNNSEPGRRNAPGRRRNGQKLANTYAAAAGNMKILVVNNPSK